MPSLAQAIVWIIVGLLGGSLAALMITRERKGFGILRNLGIGLVGALVGGQLFGMFGIFPGLDSVAVSLRDVVAALIGSLLVLTCDRAMAALQEITVIATEEKLKRIATARAGKR